MAIFRVGNMILTRAEDEPSTGSFSKVPWKFMMLNEKGDLTAQTALLEPCVTAP